MDVSILQEAFEKVYKQSPAPMQVAQELGSTLHHSLNENSAAHNSSSILELFEKTVDCNNQSAMDTSGTADKRVPMVKLKRLDIAEKNLSNCQKLYLWIIKPIPNSFGICVEGKRSLEDDDFWHSGMVTTRYSSTIIGTSSGSIYELIGEMEFLDALEAGIPEILAQQFKNGFPTTWDDLVDEHLPSDIEIGNASVLAQGPPENIFDVANTFISQQVQAVVPQQHEIVNTLVQDGSYLGEVIQQTNVQSTVADKMGDANSSNSNVSHNELVVNGNQDPYVNGNQDSVVNDDQDPDNNVHQDSVVNGNQDVRVVNEICIESEVTDSILNQTMVDKDIIDNNENILPLNKPTKKVADDILEDVDTQDRTPFTRRQKRMTSADEDMNESRQFDNSSVSTSDISFEAAKTTINGKQSVQVPKDIDAGAECHRRYENIKKVKEKMKDPPLKGRSKKGTPTVGKSKGPKSKKQNQDSLPTDTSESDFNVQSTVPTVPETNNTFESEIETISKKSAKTVSKKVTSAKNKTLPKQSSKPVADETTTEDNIIQEVVPQKSSKNSKINDTQIDKLRKAKNIASKQSAKLSHVTLPDVEITSASSADEATEASESSSQIVSRSKKDKSKSKETKPATPLFEWIIRPFPKTKGVIVEGKRSGADAYWKSSSIAERKDARTIITDRGSTYKLVGNIEKLDAIDAGFSPIIVKAFTNGFPKKWNELIEKHYVSEDRSKYLPNGTMNVSSVSTKTGKTNVASPSEVLDGTIVGTPLGQFVDINHLKTTKSGRVVKPVLAKWAGQKVVYDPSSKQMKVVYNSKFGESYFKDQCIQMSAKTSRTSSLRKKIPLNASRSRILDLSKMDSNDKKHSPSNNHKKLSKVNFEKNSVTMEPTQNDDDDDDDSVDLDRDVRILIDKNQKKRLKNPQKLQTCYSNKMEDDDDDDVMTSPSSRTRLRLHELRAKSDIRKKRKSKDRTQSDSDIDNNDLQPKRTKKSSNEIQLKNSKINSKFNVIELDSDIDDIVDQPQKTKPSYKTLPKKSKINGTVLDSDIDDIDDQHQKVKPSYKTLPKKSKINGTVLDSDIDDIDDQHQKAKPSYKTLPKKSKTNSKINGTMPDSDIDDIDDQPKKAKSRIKTQTKYSKINAKKSDYEPESESENDDEIIFKSKRESIKERTKSQTVPKSVTSKNGKVASKTKCSPVKKTVSKRRVKQTEKLKSKSLQKNPIAVSSSETDTYDDSWGKSEVFRLESALKCISQYDVNMWKRIAEAVSSRSLKECQEYVESHHEYQTFLQNVENSKRSKTNKRIEITAKKGTMKRRKQIREFLEQGIEGDEEPDLFDSTPFRAKTKKTIVPRLDEDVFSTETEFPITPGANCRTPSMKYFQAQFSAKKTPADCIVSPTNNDVNNAKADKIVHHYLKRRKMVKIKTTKKDSTIPKVKPNKPRTLFGTNGDIDDSIFQHSDHEPSDDDDDDEKDHYMSDMSSN